MADGIVNIRGKDYITVPKRMAEFRKEHTIKEGWAVVTECQDIPDKIRVKAMILNPAGMVVATGHAEEKQLLLIVLCIHPPPRTLSPMLSLE